MQLDLFENNRWNKYLYHCFYLANSSSTGEIQQKFYSLKEKVLAVHGTFDDYDKQTIIRKCWSCDDGIWYSWGGYSDICYKCDGTGVYRKEFWYLKRYSFGGNIYHVPDFNFSDGIIRNEIIGKIKHSENTKISGNMATVILFALFDKEKFSWWWNDFVTRKVKNWLLFRRLRIKRAWRRFIEITAEHEELELELRNQGSKDLPF